MIIESITNYCLSKNGAKEDFPFDEETLVFKIGGKIFALIPLEKIPLRINLKCNPERAVELREEFEAVQPGWHMSKKYWNTITVDGNVRWSDLKDWIDHSYEEVFKGLKKIEQERILKQGQ
jgi:predicted DNA-binding protein (MmcQ/YjbR family)